MKLAQSFSRTEGFRDLRRRLPSLDRAYRCQGRAQWIARTLTIAGVVVMGLAIELFRSKASTQHVPPILKNSSELKMSANIRTSPNSPPAAEESATDSSEHQELSAEQPRR